MLRNFFMMAFMLAVVPAAWAASNANDVEGIPLPIPKDARTASTGVYGPIHPNYTPELDLTNTAPNSKESNPVNVTVERVAIIPDPAFVTPSAVSTPAPQPEIALQAAPVDATPKVRSVTIPMPTPKVEPVVQAIYVTTKSDQEMMNDIQNALNTRRGLSSFAQRVRLSSNRGVITMRGLVSSDAEKTAIENLAVSIVGSQHIQSQLYTTP